MDNGNACCKIDGMKWTVFTNDVLSPNFHPRGKLEQSISVGLLTRASSYSPGLPHCFSKEWHFPVFVFSYSCGAVTDFHRSSRYWNIFNCRQYIAAIDNAQVVSVKIFGKLQFWNKRLFTAGTGTDVHCVLHRRSRAGRFCFSCGHTPRILFKPILQI